MVGWAMSSLGVAWAWGNGQAMGPRIYKFGEFPKRCRNCGCEFQDAKAWRKLKPKGVQPDDQEPLELRDCYCGSTLAAIFLPEDKP